jgi:acyl-coenzyme A thioesterase PaaI-like protein
MTARWLRRLTNVYPPYLGAGVYVAAISDDWRFARVELPLRFYNRNYFGTHFGGSLYAMTDPFLALLATNALGPDFIVWDRAAEIEFVAPGRGRVWAEFRLTDEHLAAVREHTQGGAKYEPWFEVEVRGPEGELVARVRKQLYIRRKRDRP